MSKDRIILIALWLISIAAFFLLVPRSRRRAAALSFLACQCLTWSSALLHVKFHLVEFPVREFPKATNLSITTEFIVYPVICALYYTYELERSSTSRRFANLALWVTGATLLDVILEKYTNLINYVHYAWYWSWLGFFALFLTTNLYSKWFLKNRKQAEAS